MTRTVKIRLVFAGILILVSPIVYFQHQAHCFLRGEFVEKQSYGGWGELKEFHNVRDFTSHAQLEDKFKSYRYGVFKEDQYRTTGPELFVSSHKHCFVRRYFTEILVYDGPRNPELTHDDSVKVHKELIPLGGASEICFVKRSDGDWDIRGRMLSDAENQAEKGSRVVSVPYFSVNPDGSEPAEFTYYRMHRDQFHEGQFQLPSEDDAGLGPAGYGGFVESLDFSLVVRANVRGTASPPGSAGFWSFSLLPDTRRVPQIEINVFDSKTKAIRGRIKLRFCGQLDAMAQTIGWEGPNLMVLGAPCCGPGEFARVIYGYFPRD